MSSPQLARAVLIPLEGERPSSDDSQYILVQFNPASLKVTLSNSLRADTQGGGSSAAAQYVEKSESSLAVTLLFDTTIARNDSGALTVAMDRNDSGAVTEQHQANVQAEHEANSDVRIQTKRIAEAFMEPQDPDSDNPRAPQSCRFQWGSFSFDGMLSSYNETLDFFSPEGIPLRATLQLTFKEQRFQFDTLAVSAAARTEPTLTPGGPGVSAADAASSQGQDPRDWRDTALYNGLENPRLSTSAGLAVPAASLGISAGLGVSGGLSLGISGGVSAGISGGVSAGISGGISGGLSAGVSGGVSGGLSAGVSGGLSAGASSGISSGFSAGASGGLSGGISTGLGASAGMKAGVGLSSSAQLGFSVGASSKLGTDIPGAFVQIKTK